MTGTILAFVSLLSLGFLLAGCLSQKPEASDSSCDIPLGTAKRFHNRMLELARREGLNCQMGAFHPLVIPESEGIWMPCGNVEWEFWREGGGLELIVALVPKGESEEGKRLPDFEGLNVIVTHQYHDHTLPVLKKTAQRALAFLQEPCIAPTNELSISPPDGHGLTMWSLQHFHQLMAEIISSRGFNPNRIFGCLFAGFPTLPADAYDLWQPQNDAQWSFFAKGNTNAALMVRLVPKGITPPDKYLFEFYGYDAAIHYSYEQEAGGDLALKKSVHELVEQRPGAWC